MIDNGKYIIIELNGCELPILFDSIIDHSFVGENMKVISAGKFETYIKNDKIAVSVFDESITLGKKSKPEDSKIIEKFINKKQYSWVV